MKFRDSSAIVGLPFAQTMTAVAARREGLEVH
jgi:hypothetical protein